MSCDWSILNSKEVKENFEKLDLDEVFSLNPEVKGYNDQLFAIDELFSSNPEVKGYNDQLFLEHFAPEKRLKNITIDVRKVAALRLINIFSGRSSRDNAGSYIKIMIFGLLSPTPAGSDFFYFIFDEKSELSLEIPSSSSALEGGVNKSAPFPNDANGFWRTAYTEIEKLTEADLKDKRNQSGLMYLSAIGFICLTLLQIKARNPKGMGQHMRTRMFQAFQKHYKPPRSFLKIPSISDKILTDLEVFFDFQSDTKKAFGLVLTGYIYFGCGPNVDQNKVDILNDGCLHQLMYNGMHVVKLFEQVWEKTNMDQLQLKKALYNKLLSNSLQNIMNVFEEYSTEFKIEGHEYLPLMTLKQTTWKWARYFHSGYFATCSGSKYYNVRLCARLAAILSRYPEHSGIGNMMIFHNPQHKKLFEAEIPFAEYFVQAYGLKN